MKKIVLNYLVFAALLVAAALMSCNKDEGAGGKGEGMFSLNGKSHAITESCMCVKTDGKVSKIVFNNKDGIVVYVKTNDIVLASKTYTANEIEALGFSLDGEGDFDEDNVEMAVVKSGKVYDITITGKTKENEHEYTITYKGKIRAEKDLCNQ